MRLLSLTDKISFGKYGPKNNDEAFTIQEIIKSDPDYLAWACDTMDWFELNAEAIEALDIALWSNEKDDHFWCDDMPF